MMIPTEFNLPSQRGTSTVVLVKIMNYLDLSYLDAIMLDKKTYHVQAFYQTCIGYILYGPLYCHLNGIPGLPMYLYSTSIAIGCRKFLQFHYFEGQLVRS